MQIATENMVLLRLMSLTIMEMIWSMRLIRCSVLMCIR